MEGQQDELKSKKMRDAPIGKLLLSMSVPAILSMLVMAMYNIVDSVFVSFYDPKGLDALSIAFPMQTLIIAFAIGVGVGTNAQVSKKLGEGKKEEANITARHGVMLSLIVGILFLVVGLTLSGPFTGAFTNDATVKSYGKVYLTVVVSSSIFSVVEITLSKILQSTGNMKIPMLSQIFGALTNIVLDPLFIFVFKMGVTGAAVATVIGQIVSVTFVITMFAVKKHDVKLSFKGFKPQLVYIKNIAKVGIPVLVMNAVTAFTTTFMNMILKNYDNAITILGVYFKSQSFVFMPVFGLTQGALPILSYNHGYGDKKRFSDGYKLSLIVSCSIMALGTILFQAMPAVIMKLFNASPEMLTAGSYALRIISISFMFAAFGIVNTTMLQALGMGFTSLIMSLLRQVVFLLPLALILSFLGGLKAVWFCYPISEILVFVIFLPICLVALKKRFIGKTPLSSDNPVVVERDLTDGAESASLEAERAQENDQLI